MGQRVIYADYNEISEWVKGKKVLLVCGHSFDKQKISECFKGMIRFSGFSPNPTYESVAVGVKVFKNNDCDSIVAAGGGSAIDVAKCIKLYSDMDEGDNYLKQDIVANDIPFMAIPTTAGTGSETTRFAVIYYQGEKQSVTHESCIPDTVVFDPAVLVNLPLYQKKATMLDALCHAIESFWSVNSTNESRKYSVEAVRLILRNMDDYLSGGDEMVNCQMLKAANIAGKAINITQTTAGHAMCYKLTRFYGISHGHAAALCVSKLWPFMIKYADYCTEPGEQEYLHKLFGEMAKMMDCNSISEAAGKFQGIVDSLKLDIPVAKEEDYKFLKHSVNPVRLKNNPVKLEEGDIDYLYHEILKG